MSEIHSLLIIPRLRVQNANAISSPMTWGFPAMSAFLGLMHALERKCPEHINLEFEGVGIVCHEFSPQVSDSGRTKAFHLTRNPVDKKGGTAAIVEEGRAHFDITLVFAVRGEACLVPKEQRSAIAAEVADVLAGMRVAGGTVVPPLLGENSQRFNAKLIPLNEQPDERARQFKRLRRSWLPGFSLVARDDLLSEHLAEMQKRNPGATLLDAWLDLSRLNIECQREGDDADSVRWEARRSPGWIVPIPVGYSALTEVFAPGAVADARDVHTPFRFVEGVYSVGQWISPHRLQIPEELIWYVHSEPEQGLYRCANNYRPAPLEQD